MNLLRTHSIACARVLFVETYGDCDVVGYVNDAGHCMTIEVRVEKVRTGSTGSRQRYKVVVGKPELGLAV